MQHFSFLGRCLAALLLVTAPLAAAQAQTGSVGIGTTAPDASAALDIVSSSKGLLLPRVASAAAIASPATGLLVYQTNAPAGFYYNAGTAAAPAWQQLGTTANGDNLGNHTATTNVGLNGNWLSNAPGNANGLRVDNAGNVGVGVPGPTQALDVQGGILARSNSAISQQGAYLQWNRTSGGETWLLNQQGGSGTNAGIRFGGVTTGNAVTEWGRFLNNGNFGIGTSSPGRKLDVAGSAAVSGSLQVGTAAGDGTFEVLGGVYANQAVDQQQLTGASLVGGSYWQSFTAGASGVLRQLDLGLSSPGNTAPANATLRVYAGTGTGGALLTSQTMVLAPQALGFTGLQAYPLSTPVTVVTGQVYTYEVQPASGNFAYVRVTTTSSYAGGNYSQNDNWDTVFRTYVSARNGGTNLAVTGLGDVGIGTAAPSQRLEVAGQVFSSTGGFRFPDNTVQTTAATGAAGTGFIQNQTTLQSGASFNIGGTATVGGTLSAASAAITNNATVGGTLSAAAATVGGTLTTTNAVVTRALTGNGADLGGTSGVGIRADGGLNLGQHTAGQNILVGYNAGGRMAGGYDNLFVGYDSGFGNTSGANNVFVGKDSGLRNRNGIQNTFVGNSSGFDNQTGVSITAIGYNAGPRIDGLSNATAVGANVQLRQSNTVILGDRANVGIGTSTPNFPLTVEPNQYSEFMSFNKGGGQSGNFSYTLDGGALSLNELKSGVGQLNWRLLVQSGTGNVGLGVQYPTQRLDVEGGLLVRGAAAVGNQGSYLLWNRSGGQGETWLLNQQGLGTGGIRFGRVTVADNVTEWARFLDNGNLGIGTTTPGQKLTVIGAICASLGVNCTSDGRYKRDVTTLPHALASVLQLRGVYYHWKQAEFPQMQFPDTRQLGFIAQEVEVLYPEMVTTDATGYKSVDYSRLTPVLVEALKEQQQQIEALKAEAAAAKAAASAATTRAAAAETTAAQATATLGTFEARLRALEAGGAQARK